MLQSSRKICIFFAKTLHKYFKHVTISISKEINNVNIHNIAGESAITMKMNKKVLNSSLVILLALGLGGCAVSTSTTTHKTNEAKSSQVVKQQSHKKSEKSAKTSSKNAATTNNSSSANVASSSSSSSSATNVTSSTSTNNNNSQQVVAPAKAETSSSSVKEQKSVQLGLGDVATWTDSEGITHNVDSDGMDRYTTKGSSEVQYKDWSGALPSGVTVSHNN